MSRRTSKQARGHVKEVVTENDEQRCSEEIRQDGSDQRWSEGNDQDGLLKWDQLHNEYILTGYRPATGSYKQCIRSMLLIHNETVNIHSHLFGSILFVSMPFYVYSILEGNYPAAGAADVAVFALYFFGVAVCFCLSSSFHVVNNHSAKVVAFGNQLDYLGIVLLMWGATIPTVYYGFWTDHNLRYVYWAVVSTLGLACCIATLHPRFRLPTFRAYRASMYAMLGLSAIVFIIHGLILHGWTIQNRCMSLQWMLIMACLNLTGAMFFAVRIPEKIRPVTFDIVGSSHQILHFMVIFAGLAHTVGLVKAFNHVHSE